jgi:hypothetical protein
MSPRDIKPIIDKAYQEKERTEHKSLAVQAYELFSKAKTPLDVAIALNIGQTPAIEYYAEYLRLIGIEDITKIYLEFKGDVSYFVSLCKEAKAAKMNVPQVINLLKIANYLESGLRTKAGEIHNLNGQIRDKEESLDAIKSEYRRGCAIRRFTTANSNTRGV